MQQFVHQIFRYQKLAFHTNYTHSTERQRIIPLEANIYFSIRLSRIHSLISCLSTLAAFTIYLLTID